MVNNALRVSTCSDNDVDQVAMVVSASRAANNVRVQQGDIGDRFKTYTIIAASMLSHQGTSRRHLEAMRRTGLPCSPLAPTCHVRLRLLPPPHGVVQSASVRTKYVSYTMHAPTAKQHAWQGGAAGRKCSWGTSLGFSPAQARCTPWYEGYRYGNTELMPCIHGYCFCNHSCWHQSSRIRVWTCYRPCQPSLLPAAYGFAAHAVP